MIAASVQKLKCYCVNCSKGNTDSVRLLVEEAAPDAQRPRPLSTH